jgi:uncharacterized protein (UPF0264 family)
MERGERLVDITLAANPPSRSILPAILHHPSSILSSNPGTPQLLVSVRSACEARAALAGGCHILDVKEPSRGALGMADVQAIEQVLAVAAASEGKQPIPVTAALGEAHQWLGSRCVPAVPAGVSLVKLGLARLDGSRWQLLWSEVRERMNQSAGRRLRWIAVAYADWRSAGAPPPEAIIEAAVATRCAGVLFDTYRKDGRHLLEHIAADRLGEFTERIRSAGLLVAVAGSLSMDVVPVLLELQPDVIAIRGAACSGRNRSASVSAVAVSEFRLAISSGRT